MIETHKIDDAIERFQKAKEAYWVAELWNYVGENEYNEILLSLKQINNCINSELKKVNGVKK